MRENLRGALWRLAVYAFVCVLGAFALIAVFAQLRFQSEKTYTAQFANVSGLEGGNFVRIAGVEVGKVKNIDIQPDSTVLVKFTAADNRRAHRGHQSGHSLRRPDRRPVCGTGGGSRGSQKTSSR